MKILYRYIIKQFLLTLFFALFALCVIFIIVNLMESLEEFIDQKATIKVIVDYYLYYLPGIIKLIMPISVLMAILFSIGRMSTLNEIIAMKSGTMSLYRLMAPIVVICILLSFGQLYFNGWIVPKSNHYKFKIEQKYFLKQESGGPVYNLYFRDNPKQNVMIQYYDGDAKSGNFVVIEEFSSETKPRLKKRTEAQKLMWDSAVSGWKLFNAIVREYNGNKIMLRKYPVMETKMNISNKEIIDLKKSTEEMTFAEFGSYLKLLERGGKDVRNKMIDYYGNFAFPFANLIIVLFAVPFASIKKKGGLAIQISASMIVSFLYLLFTEVSKNIGYTTEMNPVLAGWFANIIFVIVGVVAIYKTRT